MAGYRFQFELARLRATLLPRRRVSNLYDLIFVCPEKGWVLEGICRDLAAHIPGRTLVLCQPAQLPASRAYFFSHYSLFTAALLRFPQILSCLNFVYYTHTRDIGLADYEIAFALNKCSKIYAMNAACVRELVAIGVENSRISLMVGAADEMRFTPSPIVRLAAKSRCVGFVVGFRSHAHYRTRKNYDLMVDVIKELKDCNVVLVGPNWDQYERFSELRSLGHLRYLNVPYERYPAIYREMDVFVSVSSLEGGPIPLVEAMMSNVIPVVSNTGFATDIVEHGKNGFVFSTDATAAEISRLVRLAFTQQFSTRTTVEKLTWKSLSATIWEGVACERGAAQIDTP